MVTGSKEYRDFDFQTATDKPPVWDELRLWIGIHGYAWALFRGTSAERIGFRAAYSPERPLTETERIARIEAESFWTQRAATARILVAQLTPAVFPASIEPKEATEALFSITHPLNPTDKALVKPISGTPLSVVYAPSAVWFQKLEKYDYREIEWLHPMELAIARLQNQNSRGNGLCIYAQHGAIDLVIFNEGKMVLANRFQAETPQEALYYTLRAAQSAEWDPAEDELHLVGSLAGDREWQEVFQEYVRNAKWVPFKDELEGYRDLFDFDKILNS